MSGMGLDAICGNPADKVDVLDEMALAGAIAVSAQQSDAPSA
ncbi:hypothetical protein ACFQS6_12275 [Xanthomonas populi]|nr:hypothetical protein [Xanthomonas populi]